MACSSCVAFCDGENGLKRTVDIGFGGCPRRNAYAHCFSSLPDSGTTPAGALGLYGGHNVGGPLVGSERHHHPVEFYFVEHLMG